MKKIMFAAILSLLTLTVNAQLVVLNDEGRDSAYVETIKGRAQKIVDGLNLLISRRQGRCVTSLPTATSC
jgi:hypothetical protein